MGGDSVRSSFSIGIDVESDSVRSSFEGDSVRSLISMRMGTGSDSVRSSLEADSVRSSFSIFGSGAVRSSVSVGMGVGAGSGSVCSSVAMGVGMGTGIGTSAGADVVCSSFNPGSTGIDTGVVFVGGIRWVFRSASLASRMGVVVKGTMGAALRGAISSKSG